MSPPRYPAGTGAPAAPARSRQAQLARASVGTAAGTVLSRVTGLLRLVVQAAALGSLGVGTAFNLANNTPNMIHDLVLGGILAATFVPVFVDRLATRSRREAAESISAVLTLSAVVLVVATVLFELAAPVLVDLFAGDALGAGEHALAVDLLRLFAPQLLFYGAISLMSAVLATRDRFVAVGVVPILNNLVAIVVLALFAVSSRRDITSAGVVHDRTLLLLLGAGTTAGVAVQALALVPVLLRSSGPRLGLTWRPFDPAVRLIASLSGWTFGFVVANQVAVFVILALETHLTSSQPASVSAYTYAYQFFQFPFGVVAVSVMSVASPDLARAFTAGDLAGVGRRFGVATRQTLALVLPSAVAFLLLARPLVVLLLQHGDWSAGASDLTASVLVMFALGLPGFCVFLLTIRTFQAMQDTRTAFVLYVLENGTNLLVAALLYHPLGVRGLALSYSVAYTLAAVVALLVLRERLGTIGGRALLGAASRAVVLSLVMAFAVALVSALVGGGDHGLAGLAGLCCSVLAGALVYLGGAGVAGTLSAWQTSRRRRGGARDHPRRAGARYPTGH